MHQPVLRQEVLKILDPQPGDNFVDATINGGGHAKEILNKIGSAGKLLGIDWDCALIAKLEDENKKIRNLILECDNYANIKEVVARNNFKNISGIVADLGFSSWQLEAGRGFSFTKDEPLDMRYNPKTNELTAAIIINTWEEKTIADILFRFGEERFARRIAAGICQSRPFSTTRKLVEIIIRSVPPSYLKAKIHPATRTFQALRIAVNRELDNLEEFLPAAIGVLSRKGKLAVISFHSLEDRIVKNFFRNMQKKEVIKIITKKPLSAGEEEKRNNPRARSAKLRVAQKIS